MVPGFSAAGFPGVVVTGVADVPKVVPRMSSGKAVERVPSGLPVLVEGAILLLLLPSLVGVLPALVGV